MSAAIDRIRFRRIPTNWDGPGADWPDGPGRRPRQGAGMVALAAAAAMLLWWSLRDGTRAPAAEDPVWMEAPPSVPAGSPAAPAAASRPASTRARPAPAVADPGRIPLPEEETSELGIEPEPTATSEGPIRLPDSPSIPGEAPSGSAGGAGSSGTQTLLVGDAPAAIHPVLPRYPAREEALGMEATVVALVTTDTTGRVVDVRIERSGGGAFDESVRRAALAARFVVPIRNGRARAVAFRLPYEFRVD